MADRREEGVRQIEEAVARTPERKRAEAERMHGLASFMLHAIRTTIHVKQWWQLRQRLFGEADRAGGEAHRFDLRRSFFSSTRSARAVA